MGIGQVDETVAHHPFHCLDDAEYDTDRSVRGDDIRPLVCFFKWNGCLTDSRDDAFGEALIIMDRLSTLAIGPNALRTIKGMSSGPSVLLPLIAFIDFSSSKC